MYRSLIKPFADFSFALLAFGALFPIFLIVSILLSLVNRGSPFFFQVRPGKNEKLFSIIKFKTMLDFTDISGNLLPDEERLTRFGKIVRKTSLDEIPQLLNVIKGEMSLIGPRPLLPQYLPLYTPIQKKRHSVKPGMTGWAQVNGRNAITWEKKFELDVWYVSHLSFLIDLKILFITFKKVMLSQGIYQNGEAVVQVFKGEKL